MLDRLVGMLVVVVVVEGEEEEWEWEGWRIAMMS